MDLPPPPRQLTPGEEQIIKEFREKTDKLSVSEKLKMGINGNEIYTIKNGKVVIRSDASNDMVDISGFVDMACLKILSNYSIEEQEPLPYFDGKPLPFEVQRNHDVSMGNSND